jgi:hypothetical protein
LIPRVSLRQSLSDPSLLGNTLDGDSWRSWRTLLIASMGEPLVDDEERRVFTQFTGRTSPPEQRCEEFVAVKGRRAGGSRSASVIATYLSGLCSYPRLVRGERGCLLCVAADQRQADVILDYTEANFRASPVLSQLIQSRAARELRLTNGIDIEVRAADFRRLRGLTFIACIADEMAFWTTTDDSANPDTEILAAIRPGLATTNGQMYLISSPYARKGELWRSYQKHYGPGGDPLVLVCKGSSREFNPSLSQSTVDRAYERDPASAAAEFGGQFRTDVESFVSIEAVRQCTVGLIERPPATHHGVHHVAFCDMSGGSIDSAALAVGHFDFSKQSVIVDLLRERTAPHSPEEVTQDFCRTLRSYGIKTVQGDRYAGEWPREQFAKFNVTYEPSALPKSQLYQDLLPLLNSRRIELVDNPKLVNQLCGLERRTARSGRDSIDHAPNAHDDCANAIAGLAAILTQQPMDYLQFCRIYNGTTPDDPDGVDSYRRLRRTLYYESAGTFDLNRR